MNDGSHLAYLTSQAGAANLTVLGIYMKTNLAVHCCSNNFWQFNKMSVS